MDFKVEKHINTWSHKNSFKNRKLPEKMNK